MSVFGVSVGLGAALALLLQAGSAQAAIRTQYVDYMHGSAPLKGYLAYDDAINGRRPGVLLLHYRGGLQGSTLENAETVPRSLCAASLRSARSPVRCADRTRAI